MFDKKIYKLISSVSLLNAILSAVLTITVLYYNIYIGFASMVLLIYILYLEYKGEKKKRTEFDKYIERLFLVLIRRLAMYYHFCLYQSL